MIITRLLVPLFALALAAPALAAQDTVPRPPKSSSTLITAEDIERVRPSVASAYDAVQLLRPRWFKKTYDNTAAPGVPPGNLYMRAAEFWVFVNDHEMGGLNYLKALPAEQVYTLQFLRVNEVNARYGLENAPGVVVALKQH
jgi:hypothetical protein